MSKLAKCTSCGKVIRWLKTEKGKNMPVDIETTRESDTLFEYGRHISHFSTCPHADRHRKREGMQPLSGLLGKVQTASSFNDPLDSNL